MNQIVRLITSKRTFWTMLVLGVSFMAVVFGPLKVAKSETSPSTGAPAWSQSAQVTELQKDLPNADATSALVLFQRDGGLSESDKTFVLERQAALAEFSNSPFLPPVQYSADNSTALIVVPLEKTSVTKEISERVDQMRESNADGIPSGLKTYLTGAEGFQADIAGVFAGADVTLLIVTGSVVILLLLITYRSPLLWIIPLTVVGSADAMAGTLAQRVAGLFDLQLDGSVTGILSVLVFGAGTDYALLLISRYREELLLHTNRFEAMGKALREAGPAILASGLTVILALATLSFADIEGTRALGIACATGVFVAMLGALTVLPAALVLVGRWIFWPVTPKYGKPNKTETGLWAKLGRGVSKRPIVVASIGVAVLVGLAASGSNLKIGLSTTEQFLVKPEAVVGQEVLADAFSAGQGSPTEVITKASKVDAVVAAAKTVPGVDAAVATVANDEIAQVNVTINADPQSDAAFAIVQDLRDELKKVDGADALVGGLDATAYDVKTSYERDQALLIPLILGLVFIVLLVLLRSLVAPILLLLTVVGSFFASLGAGWLIFETVFGFPALAQSTFLFSFLFLVALGVDYNIFLVTRAQEESAKVGLKEGMIKALSSTGGVITSAGVLLAAVFAVLGVLPLIALTQIGVIVCLGVLLDTLLVRTVIVPALAFIAGEKFWWPRAKA